MRCDVREATPKLMFDRVEPKQCQTVKLATETVQLVLPVKAIRVFGNHDKLALNPS